MQGGNRGQHRNQIYDSQWGKGIDKEGFYSVFMKLYIGNRNTQYVVKDKDGNRQFIGDVKEQIILLECQGDKADNHRKHYHTAIYTVGQTVAGGVDNFINLFSHFWLTPKLRCSTKGKV